MDKIDSGKLVYIDFHYWLKNMMYHPKDNILLSAQKRALLPTIELNDLITQMLVKSVYLYNNILYYGCSTLFGYFFTDYSYPLWQEKHEILKEEIETIKNQIINKYDSFINNLPVVNLEFYKKIWSLLYTSSDSGTPGSPTNNFIIETNKKVIDSIVSKKEIYENIYCKEYPLSVFSSDYKDARYKLQKDIVSSIKRKIDCVCKSPINHFNKCKGRGFPKNMVGCIRKNLLSFKCIWIYSDGYLEVLMEEIFQKCKTDYPQTKPIDFLSNLLDLQQKVYKDIENHLN